jgi:hypothetical protein
MDFLATRRSDVTGRAKWRALAVVLLIAVILVATWSFVVAPWQVPSASLRYKLSVDIDDNGILRHGEGVIGVAFQSQGPLLIGNTPQWSVGTVGEAIAIDIGERGTLFVLLAGDVLRNKRNNITWGEKGYSPDAGRQALDAYFNFSVVNLPNGLGSRAKIDAFAASKASVELTASGLPLLVRFRDIQDPSSIEVVEPLDLETVFGGGVKLARAHVDIVDEPQTLGVERRLSWLNGGYPETYVLTLRDGPVGGVTTASQVITYRDFWSSLK